MNVLVTGAAGFIGSNLMHFLSESRRGWNLLALDLLTYAGNLANIAELLDSKAAQFVRADIADAGMMAKVFDDFNPDLVFHLAAESHVDRSLYSASDFVRTNVAGTQCIIDNCLRLRGKFSKNLRLVHVSTDEVYGSLGPEGRFLETTPLDPTSPYAASKAASDLMVLASVKTHKLDAVVTRCTNNYGPYQFPEKFIPLFVTNALEDKRLPLYGDGMNVRSWIYVLDHCEALLLAAEKGRNGEVYNIGSDASGEIPNIEVAKRILASLGKPESLIQYVTDRPAHDRRYAVDNSKVRSELGWSLRTSFAEGINTTLEWYKQNRHWWGAVKSGTYREFYEKHYGGRIQQGV